MPIMSQNITCLRGNCSFPLGREPLSASCMKCIEDRIKTIKAEIKQIQRAPESGSCGPQPQVLLEHLQAELLSLEAAACDPSV